MNPLPRQRADEIAMELRRLSTAYAATPLLDLQKLAAQFGVGQVLAKDEGRRFLASFKSLGGVYAGLRALARAAGTDIAGVCARAAGGKAPTALICASDGNHGLAVAAAAHFAGAPACVYLHRGVPAVRARRIAAQGAEIRWVDGAYDDAVDAAAAAASRGAGLLIADTSDDAGDAIVADVMAGYGIIAAEIRDQVKAAGWRPPTHLFVQAGVGGLACALVEGLKSWMSPPAISIVVEPENAACVAAALAENRLVRIAGDLETAAEMLSCGKASAPAIATLRRGGARALRLSESELVAAPRRLRDQGGPATTPSGAAGLAGLMNLASRQRLAEFEIAPTSRILAIVTEADLESEGV